MTIKLSDVSLGTYHQLVAASLSIIKKAENYFTEKDINLNELTKMRLIEDMAPLTFQVFSIVHHSVGAIEALKSGEFGPPNTPENLCFQDLVSMLEDANSSFNMFRIKGLNIGKLDFAGALKMKNKD